MHIYLGDFEDMTLFYDTEDGTINAVGEFNMAVTQTGEGTFEALGDKSPPLSEGFKRYHAIVNALAKHGLSIEMVISNLAQIDSEEEGEAVKAELTNRMESGDYMQITDQAMIFSTRFGYVFGLMPSE